VADEGRRGLNEAAFDRTRKSNTGRRSHPAEYRQHDNRRRNRCRPSHDGRTKQRFIGCFGTFSLGYNASRDTIILVIRSFKSKETETLYQGIRVRRFDGIEKSARRKLRMLDAATTLADLVSPGNNLEALKGDRAGQHSIRINDQYRVCFVWKGRDAEDAEIVDYH
jgi:toxin HigB-1